MLSIFFPDERSKVTYGTLLTFITGAEHVPVLGFRRKITIDFYATEGSHVRRLPSCSTCDLRLWLPRGVDEPRDFANRMDTAVLETEGFGRC